MAGAYISKEQGNYRWYVLAILTIAQTCHGIDRAIIGLVLKPLGDEFSLSGEQLGILAGLAYGIPFAIAALPFGYAVDRFNRKNLMTLALGAWSGATALCGAATGFWTMLMGRAAVGVAEAGGSPTGMSLLSDYFGPDKRATAIGIWYLSTGIGTALAFFLGGWIVEFYGWRWAFVAAGIPGLMLAPLLFLTIREPKRGQQDAPSEEASGPFRQRAGELLGRPGIFFCIAAITCIATGIYGMSTWLATFLIDSHDLAISSAGMVVAIAYGILGSVGNLVAGWGTDRINAARGGFDPGLTALLGAIIPFLTAITGLAAVGASDTTLAIVLVFAAGIFSSSYNGPIYAVIVTIAGPQLRGLAVSFVQLSANLIGVGLGAWLIGRVADEVGGRDGVAWGIAAAMMFCVVGGILLLLAGLQIKKSQVARS
ncbi:spinster family MFS transporter [Croceicoccus hydrothermalis]|uniref:spinster family MFS transporter n=1 Tax=Croceicoccus hydrothermalis TaxID=2867964 RepID=UPI001EFC1906|nr:MFS transporter [Croceicoccus hydrothermalis]